MAVDDVLRTSEEVTMRPTSHGQEAEIRAAAFNEVRGCPPKEAQPLCGTLT